MSVTQTIKDYVLGECGMDAVGVARADALSGEARGHRPEDILPGAKSIIVFTKHVPDGVTQAAFRAKEDGNADAYSIYAAYGRELTPNLWLFFMMFNLAEYIERSFGYTSVPIPAGPMQNVTSTNTPLPAFVGARRNAWVLHPEKAAVAAGLGEIAWNNAFVSAEYGPRQGIGLVLTTMELDYDAPYAGPRLCDPAKCGGLCARVCPVGAIPAPGGETEIYRVAGQEKSCAKVNVNACAVASMAFRREFSGKLEVPDQIMNDSPTDEELMAAYAKKPANPTSLGHYPSYFCDRCTLYCPIGRWKERFADRHLSCFDGKEAGK